MKNLKSLYILYHYNWKIIKIEKTNYSLHYFWYNFSFQTNYYFSTYTNLEAMSKSQAFVLFENVLLTI